MARKRRSVQATPTPPQVPRGRAAARPATLAGSPIEPGDRDLTEPAVVAAQYAYVKRDLARIFVLAIAMFALIYASTYFLGVSSGGL
jgi:hypothetical protein